MRKTLSILLCIIFVCGMYMFPVKVGAYEFVEDQYIPIDAFDQVEDSLEQWFMRLPMDTQNKKTYHDLLNTDMARTMHELLTIFDTGKIEGSERDNVIYQYGLDSTSDVYRLNEIQETFNAVYGTDIDMASLDGLVLSGSYTMIRVRDNYFIVTFAPHGQVFNPNPRGGGYRFKDGSEYWKWYYADEWHEPDIIYTIISYKNVAGYDVRAIDYISFIPPSDELLASYDNRDTQDDNVMVSVDGVYIDFDQPPIIYNDRTMVPLRAIFETLGSEVFWDGNRQTVTAIKNGIEIELTVGEYYFYRNGEQIELDTPGMIVNDRTLIPVRAVSEAMNCNVDWDAINREVIIESNSIDTTVYEFIQGTFPNLNITMQADNYTDIENDDTYITCKHEFIDARLYDLDSDGKDELIVSSKPLVEDYDYYGYCISIWEYDGKDFDCVIAKSGNSSRSAYRYFVAECYGQICLLETTGESSSGGTLKVRNIYTYDDGFLERIHNAYYNSFADEYELDNMNVSAEEVLNYINDLSDNTEFLFYQIPDSQ